MTYGEVAWFGETSNGAHAISTEPTRCTLCGAAVGLVGLFEPLEPWRFWPSPPESGALRAIIYGLCHACYTQDVAMAVEGELLRRMARSKRDGEEQPGREI